MTAETQFAPGQTLLIDADDTLWENNIYFERAIAAFISYLDHKEYSREQVREKLNEVERENVRSTATDWSVFAAPSSPASSACRRGRSRRKNTSAS